MTAHSYMHANMVVLSHEEESIDSGDDSEDLRDWPFK